MMQHDAPPFGGGLLIVGTRINVLCCLSRLLDLHVNTYLLNRHGGKHKQSHMTRGESTLVSSYPPREQSAPPQNRNDVADQLVAEVNPFCQWGANCCIS